MRRVVRDEIIPVEQRIDPDAAELPADDHRRLVAKTKAAGLWCLGAPEEHGGGGLGTFAMCVLLEEMSQHRMGLYNPGCGVFGRNPPPVIWGGTKERWPRSSRWSAGIARRACVGSVRAPPTCTAW